MEKNFGKLQAKERKIANEKDFYFLIEKKLKDDGYQLLDTLKRITENRKFTGSCWIDCRWLVILSKTN